MLPCGHFTLTFFRYHSHNDPIFLKLGTYQSSCYAWVDWEDAQGRLRVSGDAQERHLKIVQIITIEF